MFFLASVYISMKVLHKQLLICVLCMPAFPQWLSLSLHERCHAGTCGISAWTVIVMRVNHLITMPTQSNVNYVQFRKYARHIWSKYIARGNTPPCQILILNNWKKKLHNTLAFISFYYFLRVLLHLILRNSKKKNLFSQVTMNTIFFLWFY